jgi:pimeloyl-ACP methyl ester carboxylesterase
MTQPTLNYVNCPDTAGGHRMAYWQWGRPTAHMWWSACTACRARGGILTCWRGRCPSRPDARAARVVCPDVVGRGESDWLKDPMGYQLRTYAGDMLAMLGQLHAQAPVTSLDWVGTSMGGLIGVAVCGTPGLPLPAPVRRLVLNDVGPAIQWQAIVRIGTYLGQAGHFGSVQEAADAMWAISRSFGPHTPEQWLALSRPMLRRVSEAADAQWRLHYDPAIAVPFKQETEESARQGEAMLWQLYDNIKAETLVIRGRQSDLLSPQTAQAMTQRGPRARVVEFEGVGHAPTLIAADQVAAVTGFLLG